MIVAVVHTFVAWGNRGPVIVPDETGALGTAKVLSGTAPDWTLAGSGFMPGLGVLLTPAWWFTTDSWVVYSAGLGIVVAASVALVWPLAGILRSFGATQTGAVVIAGVIAIAPARTVPSNYVMAESLVALTTALTVYLAINATRQPGPLSAILLGASASSVFLVHGRGLAVVVATLMWAFFVWRHQLSLALLTTVAATAGTVGSWLLYSQVASELYWSDNRVTNQVDGLRDASVSALIQDAIGMGWYAVVAWPAIFIAGSCLVVWHLRSNPTSGLILLISAGSFAMALVSLSDPADAVSTRIDTHIYGRYSEQVFIVFAAIGLSALVRIRSWLLSLAVAGTTVAVLIAFHLFTLPAIPVGGRWFDVHFSGVAHYFSHHNFAYGIREPWELFSVVTLVVTIAFVGVARIKSALILVAGLYFLSLSIANDVTRIDPWDEYQSKTEEVAKFAEILPSGAAVAMDAEIANVVNLYSFALNPHQLTVVYLDDGYPGTPYLYSYRENDDLRGTGARPTTDVDPIGLVIWVYPGPEQDALLEEGILED